MNRQATRLSSLAVAAGILLGACTGCARKSDSVESNATPPLPSPPPSSASATPPPAPSVVELPPLPDIPLPGPSAVAAGASGSLTVEPNPVPVCDATGLGVATVSWTMAGTKSVEIHVDGPSGNLFASANAPGTQKTGPWIRRGTTFYLQNLTKQAKLNEDSSLARVRVETVAGGPCP